MNELGNDRSVGASTWRRGALTAVAAMAIGGVLLLAAPMNAGAEATPTTTVAASSNTTTTVREHQGTAAGRSGQQANKRERRALLRPVVVAVADRLDMKPRALMRELRSGSSIADVAADHDVSVDSVIDTVVAAAKDVLADHPDLPAAKLTDSELRDRAEKLVNRTWGKRR